MRRPCACPSGPSRATDRAREPALSGLNARLESRPWLSYRARMLRSFDVIRSTAPTSRLIAGDADHAVLTGGGMSYRAPWHWHDCLMILLPKRGAIGFKDETRRSGLWLTRERYIAVPGSWAHETEATRGGHAHVALYLTDRVLARMESQLGSFARLRRRMTKPSAFAVTPEIQTLQHLCCGDAHDRAAETARQHLAAALLVHLLGQIERSEPLSTASRDSYGDLVVAEISSFIAMRVAEDVPLDEIADAVGLSRRHTTRLFRQRTGLSIVEYHERQRIEMARTLLIETTLPVGEIAWRVGFESGSALARAMRRVIGLSPSGVRGGNGGSAEPTLRQRPSSAH